MILVQSATQSICKRRGGAFVISAVFTSIQSGIGGALVMLHLGLAIERNEEVFCVGYKAQMIA